MRVLGAAAIPLRRRRSRPVPLKLLQAGLHKALVEAGQVFFAGSTDTNDNGAWAVQASGRAWALWLGMVMLQPLEAKLEVVPVGKMVFKEDRSSLGASCGSTRFDWATWLRTWQRCQGAQDHRRETRKIWRMVVWAGSDGTDLW